MFKKLILSFLLLGFVTSCFTKKATDELVKSPDNQMFISGKESKELISNSGTDTVENAITYRLYAQPKEAYQDSVNALIGSYIWFTSHFEAPKYTYKTVNPAFFNERLTAFNSSFKEFEKESETFGVWSYEATVEVIDEWKDFVLVSMSVYTYTGGAHPNGFSENIWKKKSNGRDVYIDDWVTNRDKFNQIVEKYFRISRDLSPEANLIDEGFWFDNGIFSYNGNFAISGANFIMEFNAYEIGPYVMGPTIVEIPLDELKGCFKIPERK